MLYRLLKTIVYLGSFAASLYALSSVRFDKICFVSNPNKVRLLLILLAMGIAYLVSEYLLGLTVYNY